MRYRRANAARGTYFFTVNLAERRSDLLVRHIDDLRAAMKVVKNAHPFAILAVVVLPEHLHAIWRLPPDDADYPLRWSLIKAGVSRRLTKSEHIRASRQAKRAAQTIPQHTIFHRNSPVMRTYPITHIAMKCRMRPINRTLNMPVFKRVEMNVIDIESAWAQQRAHPT